MRLALLAAAVLAAAGLGAAYAAGAFGESSRARPAGVAPPPPDATALAAIRHLVLRSAAEMGDPSPTDGILVPTTRRRAELVDIDTNEPDTAVYFVLVHGRFTDGTLLALTIDPGTNQSIDAGLVGAMPDLSSMGEPESLPLAD